MGFLCYIGRASAMMGEPAFNHYSKSTAVVAPRLFILLLPSGARSPLTMKVVAETADKATALGIAQYSFTHILDSHALDLGLKPTPLLVYPIFRIKLENDHHWLTATKNIVVLPKLLASDLRREDVLLVVGIDPITASSLVSQLSISFAWMPSVVALAASNLGRCGLGMCWTAFARMEARRRSSVRMGFEQPLVSEGRLAQDLRLLKVYQGGLDVFQSFIFERLSAGANEGSQH